jgi:hypothetical protein
MIKKKIIQGGGNLRTTATVYYWVNYVTQQYALMSYGFDLKLGARRLAAQIVEVRLVGLSSSLSFGLQYLNAD